MATTYYTDIQKLYVAYFNRPADVAGLNYYEGVLEAAKGSATVMAQISADFAKSTEYTAAFSGKTSAQIVDIIYTNIFGHAADAPGNKFYADNLDAGKVTVANVVQEVAKGAQGTDLTAYNNKVTAAGVFTAALDTDAEKAGYSGADANKVAKAFLTAITDNVSLTAATTPAALNASVAATVAAGTPFSVTGALAQVSAAQAIQDAFVKAAVTTDVNLDGVKNSADIAAAQSAAVTKVVADLGGATSAAGTLYGASTTTQVVRDALVSAQQATLAGNLTTAQTTLAADNAAIAKVAGLTDAVALLTAAVSAQKSAVAAEVVTHADITAKEASFGVANGGVFVDNGTTMTFTPTGGAPVILADIASGKATLHTGVDATKYVGLTDLIASYNAESTAVANVATAGTNVTNAKLVANMLDMAADTAGSFTVNGTTYANEKALVAAIAAQINATTPDTVAAGATPTLAQIQTELAVLKATNLTAFNTFTNLINAEAAGVSDQSSAASSALTSANATLTTANNNLTAANSALTAANAALATAVTAATAASTALTAVETAFEGGSNVTVSSGNLVFTANGASSATTLATIDGTGHAVVAAGIDETTNPGVTDLIAKFNANVNAAATVTADQAIVTADQAAVTSAQAAVTSAQTAVATANANVALVGTLNPLTVKQAADTAAVTAANDAITKLAKDVAALATANANVSTLAGNQASIDAYNKVLTDKGYVVTTLDTAHSGAFTQFGTAASDVFIVKGNAATIGAFGLQGSDALFVGSGYTLVQGSATGTSAVKGSDALVEIFASNNSTGDAVLQIETHAYSSNVASTTGEIVTITLTGVDATTLHLNNGIITAGV